MKRVKISIVLSEGESKELTDRGHLLYNIAERDIVMRKKTKAYGQPKKRKEKK